MVFRRFAHSPTQGRAFYVALAAAITTLSCTLSVGHTASDRSPSAPPQENGWRLIAPGIERRDMSVALGRVATRAIALRFDPTLVTFRVHYSPGAPRSQEEWRAELPQAAAIINGGLFDEADRALGLVVAAGQSYGRSFIGFGGMFQVGWDGVRVRSLVNEPYQGEPVLEAVQSFPMLVEAGGIQAPQGEGFDQRSRRTAIAQDRAGKIVVVVFYDGLVSLAELQNWLIASDLDIWIAVALDGGRSTGLDVLTSEYRESYPSWSRLPAVIAVYVPPGVE